MQDSIFTKIIKGEIPSHKIYEDDKTFAFLDIHPINEGHTLVVPKRQVEFLWDLPDEDYNAVMQTVKMLSNRYKSLLGVPYIGLKVIGVDVPHAHIHVIPFHESSELDNEQDLKGPVNHENLKKLRNILDKI